MLLLEKTTSYNGFDFFFFLFFVFFSSLYLFKKKTKSLFLPVRRSLTNAYNNRIEQKRSNRLDQVDRNLPRHLHAFNEYQITRQTHAAQGYKTMHVRSKTIEITIDNMKKRNDHQKRIFESMADQNIIFPNEIPEENNDDRQEEMKSTPRIGIDANK